VYYISAAVVFFTTIAPASKDLKAYHVDSGSPALQGIRRNDGNSDLLLPEQ
jgi:hypothetical protein